MNQFDLYFSEKKKAFIDLLLDISDKAPESFSTNDLLEEVTTFMFAVSKQKSVNDKCKNIWDSSLKGSEKAI